MDSTRTGGCECRALRYALTKEPLGVGACHCTQCQRQSGSAFSLTMVVEESGFEWLEGEPTRYVTQADSGTRKECFFCGTCGVRIYNVLRPGSVNLKPGTLDDTSWFTPAVHVWLASKQPWVPLPAEGARFDHNPGE